MQTIGKVLIGVFAFIGFGATLDAFTSDAINPGNAYTVLYKNGFGPDDRIAIYPQSEEWVSAYNCAWDAIAAVNDGVLSVATGQPAVFYCKTASGITFSTETIETADDAVSLVRASEGW